MKKILKCGIAFRNKYPHIPSYTIEGCCKVLLNEKIMERLENDPADPGPGGIIRYANQRDQIIDGIYTGFDLYEKEKAKPDGGDRDLCEFIIYMLNDKLDYILNKYDEQLIQQQKMMNDKFNSSGGKVEFIYISPGLYKLTH